jgi:hypothetical protein
LRAARDGAIPAQALGEFLRFVQRRAPDGAWQARSSRNPGQHHLGIPRAIIPDYPGGFVGIRKGGPGTIACALDAGVPMLILPSWLISRTTPR